MRVLGKGVQYTFTVIDKQSEDEKGQPTKLIFHYRLPTTSERQQYLNALDPKDESDEGYYIVRIKWAMIIVSGIGEGCFGRMDSAGKVVPISSDPKSEFYYEQWRDEIAETAGDVLAMLARLVFDKPFLDSVGKN